MTDTIEIPGNRILSFIERVEHIDEELKALNEGKKEVFSEAKGEGFDVKVLKEILRLTVTRFGMSAPHTLGRCCPNTSRRIRRPIAGSSVFATTDSGRA